MSVLALDLGLITGWARADGRTGTFSVRGIPDHGQALALFQDWIDEQLDAEPLIYLAVERGFGGNNANGRLTTQMEGAAHASAWARNIPRTDRGAPQVRKWLLGYGRVSPIEEPSKTARTRLLDGAVMAAVRARGFLPASEHEADAAALLCCCEQRQMRETAA